MDVLLHNLVKWLVGLAIPTLLAMFVPRRWLAAKLAIWSLLPVVGVLVLLLGEVVRTPSELAEPDKILLALRRRRARPWKIGEAAAQSLPWAAGAQTRRPARSRSPWPRQARA
jgi:hypothetical protein